MTKIAIISGCSQAYPVGDPIVRRNRWIFSEIQCLFIKRVFADGTMQKVGICR